MSLLDSEIEQVFNALESHELQDANEARIKLGEVLNNVKDSWVIVGFINYYVSTRSTKIVDILVKAPVPHDKYLCDRLAEGLRGNWRTEALTLLGHIIRKQPFWLHKIVKLTLFKDLLHLLKNEKEIVPLMSGLLLLITLLPMIPTLVNQYLQDFFIIFGRLAAWECHHSVEPSSDGHKMHLQFALINLFQILYAMFPCNFVDFLKKEYNKKENMEVFTHTVKPMLESVKMHPLLITSSKDNETDTARWKKKEYHDVLFECRRFSSENTQKQRSTEEDKYFRSRCGTDVASLNVSSHSHFQSNKSSNSTPNLTETQTHTNATMTTNSTDISLDGMIFVKSDNIDPGSEKWFPFAETCGTSSTLSAPQTPLPLPISNLHNTPVPQTSISQIPVSVKQQDSGSPPEAAIEATPENTPIKDAKQRFNFPYDSPAVRSLGPRLTHSQSSQHQPITTLSYSQPPSPLRKELSPFNRMSSIDGNSSNDSDRKDFYYTQSKLSRILNDRSQASETFQAIIPSPHKQNITGSPLKKIVLKDNSSGFMPSVPNSPVPIGTGVPITGSADCPLAKPKPQKYGIPINNKESINNLNLNITENMNREDREIMELSKRGEVMRSNSITRDLPSYNDFENKTLNSQRNTHENNNHEEGDEHWDDDELPCEENPQCTDRKHGLHMPSSNEINGFYRDLSKRSRYYSQCIVESTSNSISKSGIDISFKNKSYKIKRSLSNPEIKKVKNELNVLIKETKCEIPFKGKKTKNNIVAYTNGNVETNELVKKGKHVETQTVEVWLEYDHMFLDILSNIQQNKNGDISLDDNCNSDITPYYLMDKHMESLAQGKIGSSFKLKNSSDEISTLREQLHLLHLELLYERHLREVHAGRNRRLMGRLRKNRIAEEQNQALKQQLSSLEIEIDELRHQVNKQKKNFNLLDFKHKEENKHWQIQIHQLESQIQEEQSKKEKLNATFLEYQANINESSADIQHLRAKLFETTQLLQRVQRKLEVGDHQMECRKHLQRELIIYGEKDIKYKEEIANTIQAKIDKKVNKLIQQYKDQLANAQSTVNSLTSKMEFLQARETELEAIVSNKEAVIQDLKKQLHLVKEEYSGKLKAVEDKYQCVKRINQNLDAHCLELLKNIPLSPPNESKEVICGLSPQSSTLSDSLASSEGSALLLASRIEEMKNLQTIANNYEVVMESTSNSVNNVTFDDRAHID